MAKIDSSQNEIPEEGTAVLWRLTGDHLRTILSKLDLTAEKGKRKNEDLVEVLITSGHDLKKVCKLGLAAEAGSAPKHVFPTSFKIGSGVQLPGRKRVFGVTTCPNLKRLALVVI